MRRLTGWLMRAVMIVAVGLSFGIVGVVGEATAQSDTMQKDDTKQGEMKQNDMKKRDMKKGDVMKKGMPKKDMMMEKKQ